MAAKQIIRTTTTTTTIKRKKREPRKCKTCKYNPNRKEGKLDAN